MPNPKPVRIVVGRRENLCVIKLIGRCTLTMGTGLKELLDQCRRPHTTAVYFDLSETEHLDSTCVGLIVSLALKTKDPCVPSIHLLSPTPAVVHILESMRVLEYLDRCETLPAAVTTWEEIPAEVADRDEMAAVIINAHENLIRADARNAEEFRPVVDGLRAQGKPDRAKDL